MSQKRFTLPTLSSSGLLVSPKHILERLFIYFRTSSRKQSTIYKDQVTSYRYLEHMYNDDLDNMRVETIAALTALYSQYFTDVGVEVSYKNISHSLYSMELLITVTDEMGRIHTYNTELDVDKSRDMSRW